MTFEVTRPNFLRTKRLKWDHLSIISLDGKFRPKNKQTNKQTPTNKQTNKKKTVVASTHLVETCMRSFVLGCSFIDFQVPVSERGGLVYVRNGMLAQVDESRLFC